MKMNKKKKLKKNQGNSFIMVVATISFLAVLVAALLVAVALCYRLKAYDINARDNFYYLEQAMDEIYAGVGGDAMTILNQAYDDTLEVMVYYDTDSKTYVTMDNETANKMLKATFMNNLKKDERYADKDSLQIRLESFLSYPYKADTEDGREGIQLSLESLDKSDEDELVATNLVLKREAKYSTVNARSRKDSTAAGKGIAAGDTFIQTITTDLVIGKPQFDVSFNTVSADLSDLYGFSMISDMGIEITGKNGKTALGKNVDITGNIYAASDFYNKKYNEEPGELVTVNDGATTVKKEQIQKVNSYSDDKLKQFNGVNQKSMYSGLYVDGATVVMSSDRVIVPGSLALMNCADLTISSLANSSIDYADLWVDGIVLDGYALKQNTEGTVLKGSSLNMKARAYVYDDLEVNANSSKVLLNGQYFGYNYASTDNRTYTTESIKNGTRAFSAFTDKGITDGVGIEGQAHYNSSAIILNGENTNLDFSLVSALYVAGQSYIEVSKDTKESEDTEKIEYSVQNGQATLAMEDEVKTETNSYPTVKEEDGKITDNYTKDNDSATPDKTPIQDYRTGEAISVKSNQLAYIPSGQVHEENGKVYVSIPERLKEIDLYKGIWENINEIPVIKTVISGKTYYFFDFSQILSMNVMNKFIANYASLFDKTKADEETGMTQGEAYGLVDITDYDYFQVEMLKVTTEGEEAYNNIYTNSAITSKVGDKFTIVASSKNKAPLLEAVTNINAAIEAGNNNQTKLSSSAAASTLSQNVSATLQNQYKEMKWLLTNSSTNGSYVTEAHTLKEEVITPINHYFDFSLITNKNSRYCPLNCGYGAWVSNGDIVIGADHCKINGETVNYSDAFAGGKVRGIVLAKGEVSFEEDVQQFEGLIVTGGKIVIDNFDTKQNMSFLANEEIVKTVLRECDASRGEEKSKRYGFVCDIFRLFQSQYVPPADSDDTPVVSMKDVSAVQFEDILSFRNWARNVD